MIRSHNIFLLRTKCKFRSFGKIKVHDYCLKLHVGLYIRLYFIALWAIVLVQAKSGKY